MNSRKIQNFHKRLHAWYATYGRTNLPWRITKDPYAIYISEVMLQQTQVKTVLERYYFPFLKKFPTLKSLAAASSQSVMKAWEGLGYYTRAANLHKAAKLASPALPDSFDALLALPGIGRNTAHAILAFGFRKPYAVMEANVKRVLCRVFALQKPAPDILWEMAEMMLDKKNPFDYNQAMMDIGALVCTKTLPHCNICPLATICEGKSSPQRYPNREKKKKVPIRKKKIIILQNSKGELYLEKRTGKFLNGLYGFLEIENTETALTFLDHSISITKQYKIGHIQHQYSHFTLEADVYKIPTTPDGTGFYSLKKIENLPLSKADQKAVACFSSALS
jgi:A/G-specific adenine glycosylase